MGITGAAEVLVFITAIVGLAVISLQKQPGAAQGVRLRRAVRQSYRPPGSKRTGPSGFRASCSPNQVRQLHNSALLANRDLVISGLDARTRA
jgi:hypothetical protein